MLYLLFTNFLLLSLLAIGGANAVIPEMHRVVVEQQHWMNGQTFASLFAIAQAAPGPNVLVVTLIGWHVAGLPGALVTTLAMTVPAAVVAVCASRYLFHSVSLAWRRRWQLGLAPVTLGLICAAAMLLARLANTHLAGWGITLLACLFGLGLRANPLWMLAIGALCGVLFGL